MTVVSLPNALISRANELRNVSISEKVTNERNAAL